MKLVTQQVCETTMMPEFQSRSTYYIDDLVTLAITNFDRMANHLSARCEREIDRLVRRPPVRCVYGQLCLGVGTNIYTECYKLTGCFVRDNVGERTTPVSTVVAYGVRSALIAYCDRMVEADWLWERKASR